MADDDRAAKAARAKAMLKRRQQKKTESSHHLAGRASPSSPISRALSPSSLPAGEDGTNEFGELVPKQPPDVRAQSPRSENDVRPTSASVPANMETAPPFAQADDNLPSLMQNQHHTISLLVAEKASLTESLERLEGVDSKLQATMKELQEQVRNSGVLSAQLRQLQIDYEVSANRTQELFSDSMGLREKAFEQDRELKLTHANAEELRNQVEDRERRVRELEDQIQSDDRVERLENSLQNTQNRTDELEFQLSKLRQAYSKVKSEYDEVGVQLRRSEDAANDWKNKHNALQQYHTSAQQQLTSLTNERDILLTAKSTLESTSESSQKTLLDLQQKLSQAASELVTKSRQLDNAHMELQVAIRRADDAEKSQRDLQNEGSNLMRSLEEMRPKIVELTSVKLDLTDKVDGLRGELHHRDSTIAQLEAQLNQLQQSSTDVARKNHDLELTQERERQTAEKSMSELQRAYEELQIQLESKAASVRDLDKDRTLAHQINVRQQEEIERLHVDYQSRVDEIIALKEDLDECSKARGEERRLLSEVQTEVEALRVELTAKDDEILRLHSAISSSISPNASSQTLNEEVLGALRQQHALELWTTQSQVRDLETSVYEAEAKARTFQMQNTILEDELAQLRSALQHKWPLSPGAPAHQVNIEHIQPDDLRRPSFTSLGSNHPSPAARSGIDQNLSPTTRHQRQVSLSMLKARMDSEAGAAVVRDTSRPSSRAMSPAPKRIVSASNLPTVYEPTDDSIVRGSPSLKRSQFLDESHVFWCASCKGDLIVL